jgi:hypothetical protein
VALGSSVARFCPPRACKQVNSEKCFTCMALFFLPQICNRIAIWGLGRSLYIGQARVMGRNKLLHGFASVVARSILHDKNRLRGMCQDVEQNAA